MKEASVVKFYFVKYFFLAFGLLQGMAATAMLMQFQASPKNRFAFFVFFTIALILFSAHFFFFSKVKRVALSKKKIAIIYGHRTKQFDWSQVKELKLVPYVSMYSLKLKGKNKIYFLPAHDSSAIFGMFHAEPEFIPKKVKA